MYIIYKSNEYFTNMVLFIFSRTVFGDIYKFIYGFRNIKNINIMNKITKKKKYFKDFVQLICFSVNYAFHDLAYRSNGMYT